MAQEEIETILKSMGVENAEPLVAVALQEYANRFASNLLCDSRDYATHAGHADIEVSDAKMAIAMSDVNILSHDPRQKAVMDVKPVVNKFDLARSVDENAWVHRYPKDPSMVDPTKSLMQRTYTLVPSTEVSQQQAQLGEHQSNQTDSFQPMQVTS